MSTWIKDIGEHLVDDENIVMSRDAYRRLDAYDGISQATNPSIGRVYRLGDNCRECRTLGDPTEHPHLVVFVEQDEDPSYVLRRGRVPLFL